MGLRDQGADQPGTLSYKVTLGYADGKTDNVTVDVNAVAPGSVGSTTSKSGGSSSTANAALAIGVVALVLAGAGLVMGLRRGRLTPPPASTEASKTEPAASKAQDW